MTTKKAKALSIFESQSYDKGYNDGYASGFFKGQEFTIKEEKKEPKWQDIGPRINLAGVQYSDYQLIAGGLKSGTVVDLVGEPGNPHDSKAIRIEYQKISLGYVPRSTMCVTIPCTLQYNLWMHHNKGAKIIGVITEFHKFNPTWCMITIQCKLTYRDKDETVNSTPKDVRF